MKPKVFVSRPIPDQGLDLVLRRIELERRDPPKGNEQTPCRRQRALILGHQRNSKARNRSFRSKSCHESIQRIVPERPRMAKDWVSAPPLK